MFSGKRTRYFVSGFVATALAVGALALPATATAPRVTGPQPIKGISVLLNDTIASLSDAALATKFDQVATYVKSLNANAVSIDFPFEITSFTSNDPHAGAGTPTPARLAMLIRIARAHGLSVQIRPSLDETGWPIGSWRGTITPSNVPLWMANYTSFLTPYFEAARQAGAREFVIGVELSSLLPRLDLWSRLIQTAKTLFGPNIQYSQSHNTIYSVPGTSYGWDFYTAIASSYVKTGVTVANLQTGMQAVLNTPVKDDLKTSYPSPIQLRNMTLEEVGISAVANAYLYPTRTAAQIQLISPGAPIVRSVQTNWFTAACNVMWANHMQGMYYYSLYLPDWHVGENDSTDYFLWSGTTSETAIKNCFARTS